MTFQEAMRKAYDNPAGDNAVAVHRIVWNRQLGAKSWDEQFVFYDSSLFLGVKPFGFKIARNANDNGIHYAPTMDDIEATDWEIMDVK